MVNRATLRSTVDSQWWHPERLAGRGSPTLQSPGALRVLTEGFGGRFDGVARPAVAKGERRR
jgi:hypothetical protein